MKNLILVFAFLLAFPLLRLSGQCTTSAGTILGDSITICTYEDVQAIHIGNQILDSNDTLIFALFKNGICVPANVIIGKSTPFFNITNYLDTNIVYGIAAVAGNKSTVPGLIDWGDPCLSISYGFWFQVSATPTVTKIQSFLRLDCLHDSLLLTGNSNQPNCSFEWTSQSQFFVTSEVNKIWVDTIGEYLLHVENEFGCKTTADFNIYKNVVIPPFITYPHLRGISCVNPQAIFPIFPNSNYQYNWEGPNGFVSTNDSLFAPFIGQYTGTVTNSGNGCTQTLAVSVIESGLQASSGYAVYPCQGESNGELDAGNLAMYPLYQGNLGLGPFKYQWSGPNGLLPDTTETITNLPEGVYKVSITNSTGCVLKYDNFWLKSPFLYGLNLNHIACNNNTVDFGIINLNSPINYQWSTPGITGFNLPSGIHSVTITDANGCVMDTIINLDWGCAQVKGKIARKTDDLCLSNTNQPLKNWTIQATGINTYYATSDENGNYLLDIDTGYYVIKAIPPNAWIWENCSPSNVPVYLPNINQTVTANFDFKALQDCPILEVDITMPALVRCIDRNMTLNWCNYGPDTAYSAYIILDLDTAIQITDLQYPYTSLGNGQYQIDIGNVHPNDCKMTNIGIKTSCFTELGQTLCIEAHIYPDTLCHPPINPLWSGANIDLQSDCGSDSLRFTIKNTGFGAINDALEFVVIEDCILRTTGSVPPLASGDSIIIAVPANGATWRVESEQAAYHPYQNQPMLTVEGCAPLGSFSTGFVNHFPFNDADPWLDIQCGEVVGSYDPNDKTGFPLGVGNEHFIAPNTELTYVIRFQNTGTYQALNIIVKDTLSEYLNPSTIRPTGASHPYRWDLSGEGILTFYFDNINLPMKQIHMDGQVFG
jgi:uncharacterized repeat protein (TIGR01451 family)